MLLTAHPFVMWRGYVGKGSLSSCFPIESPRKERVGDGKLLSDFLSGPGHPSPQQLSSSYPFLKSLVRRNSLQYHHRLSDHLHPWGLGGPQSWTISRKADPRLTHHRSHCSLPEGDTECKGGGRAVGMRTWASKPASQPISWPQWKPRPGNSESWAPLGGNRGAFILHS